MFIASPLHHRGWCVARAAYLAARKTESEYERTVYMPAFNAALPDVSSMSKAIDAEGQRLTDLRSAAEDVLMAIPAATPADLLFKFLIARADERGADGWDNMLVEEAFRFLPDFPLGATGS